MGQSDSFQVFKQRLHRVARTGATVLLSGAAGAGKSLLAQTLHQASPRRQQALVQIDCRSVQHALANVDGFAEKPALALRAIEAHFTDRLPDADGGTLVLDDIEALPWSLQAMLVRFIDMGEVPALGNRPSVKVNSRLIATTGADLADKVAAGVFRGDLYFRLNVITLEIPPLCQRRDHILPLMQHFMRAYAKKYQLAACTIEADALRALRAYSWPNNLAELRQVSERLALTRAGQRIEEGHLPEAIRHAATQHAFKVVLPEKGIAWDAFEADLIRQALKLSHGNRTRSARLLGLSRDTLLYRMQKHGIACPARISSSRRTTFSTPLTPSKPEENAMNKAELIHAVADKTGASKAEAQRHLEALIDTVVSAVSQGEKVQLVGFGTFKSQMRPAREGRNPQNGQPIQIGATTLPKFEAGEQFKTAVARAHTAQPGSAKK